MPESTGFRKDSEKKKNLPKSYLNLPGSQVQCFSSLPSRQSSSWSQTKEEWRHSPELHSNSSSLQLPWLPSSPPHASPSMTVIAACVTLKIEIKQIKHWKHWNRNGLNILKRNGLNKEILHAFPRTVFKLLLHAFQHTIITTTRITQHGSHCSVRHLEDWNKTD